MAYSLTVGPVSVVGAGFAAEHTDEDCSCRQARERCMPSFVFSVPGQVHFRTALRHLATCNTRECQQVKGMVFDAMQQKLRWLFQEECLLGCVIVQPALYGARRVHIHKRDFTSIAGHLARCPKETCAQLRRALLLNIRDTLRPSSVPES